MKYPLKYSLLLPSLLVLASTGCFAQTAGSGPTQAGPVEDLHGLKVREIHPRPTPTPFPLDAKTDRVQALQFRGPQQMTAADQELVAANQSEIARRASLQGFGLGQDAGQDGWGYEQGVCPVFPDHVILEYSRNNGKGDVTLFSVVVPRVAGHVRVIPVQRRGYSLFTPAASNALTLNDFNHIVLEENRGTSPDWLTIGLCYAALTGGHVRAGLLAASPAQEKYPLFIPATLEVSGKGGASVRFADTAPLAISMDWNMTFAQNGRLLKVKHSVSRKLTERPVNGSAIEVRGVPTRESAVEVPAPQK